MNPANLNVFVVDDDEAVRRNVVTLLGMRGHRVQAFASGEDFLERADLVQGGCVILDRKMDGMSGLEVFAEMRRRASPLVVLFLSGHGDIPTAWDAARNGAYQWLPKPCDESELLDKVGGALDKAADVASSHRVRQSAHALWQELTPREREVALLVAQGLSNKLIARPLKIGVRTAEGHRAKVYLKLSVSNPVDVGRFIRDNDL